MLNQSSTVLVGSAISLLISSTNALDAPCYGYGNIMGEPSNYIDDDMIKVKSLKVGQGSTYVAYINYLFEGKNHMELGY